MSDRWKLQDMERLFEASKCHPDQITRDHNEWGFHLAIDRLTPVTDADTERWGQYVCDVLDDAGIAYRVLKVHIGRHRWSVQEGAFYHAIVLDIPEVKR
jgi:hypothetical protein